MSESIGNINAKICLTKFLDTFVGQDGNNVNFEYVEVEFAPNCYCRFKLNNANKRCLQKYAPNMYHLLTTIPYGCPVAFEEMPLDSEVTSIGDLYKNAESTSDSDMNMI